MRQQSVFMGIKPFESSKIREQVNEHLGYQS